VPAMEEGRSHERSSVAPGRLRAHALGLAEEEEAEAVARGGREERMLFGAGRLRLAGRRPACQRGKITEIAGGGQADGPKQMSHQKNCPRFVLFSCRMYASSVFLYLQLNC
jgi:hypothetical protein